MGRWRWKVGVGVAVGVGLVGVIVCHYSSGSADTTNSWGSFSKESAVKVLGEWSERLGIWAIPAYVAIHTVTLVLCLPYAVFFETAASLLFGFFPGVLCVFSAKVLAASLSFLIGRYKIKLLYLIS